MNDGTPFRILSLDGGGIRGMFSAAFLAHIEKHSHKMLRDHFDLIVGTSTGAIIALGLAAGLPASDILTFYEERGPVIFSKGSFIRQLFRAKYDNKQLIEALREVFGERCLNDLTVPVCIPSYELVQGCPRVFKDNHHLGLHWGGDKLIWKVACASAAAPTYFPAFQVDRADSHIDGGIWANNPVLVGITEAVKYFGQPLENISVLSVSTGSQAFRLTYETSRSLGLIGWARRGRFLNAVFGAQSQSAHFAALFLLDDTRYLRVDPDLSGSIPLDGYKQATQLLERGAQEGRTHLNKINDFFLSSPRTMPEQ